MSSGATLTVGTGVTFGTVNRDGARTRALGLRVETGGTATLNGVTLGEGHHHWSGRVTVAGDLTVTDTLAVAAGSEVRFAAGDSTNSGDRSRTELIGGLRRQAEGAGRWIFRGVGGRAAVVVRHLRGGEWPGRPDRRHGSGRVALPGGPGLRDASDQDLTLGQLRPAAAGAGGADGHPGRRADLAELDSRRDA